MMNSRSIYMSYDKIGRQDVFMCAFSIGRELHIDILEKRIEHSYVRASKAGLC